jgi:hypothetical protein
VEPAAEFFKRRAGKATGEGLMKFLRTAPKSAPAGRYAPLGWTSPRRSDRPPRKSRTRPCRRSGRPLLEKREKWRTPSWLGVKDQTQPALCPSALKGPTRQHSPWLTGHCTW